MKVFIFFWIKAAVTIVFSLFMLLIPLTVSSWFGIGVSAEGGMFVQLLGALFFGIAFICFFSSRSESSLSVRNTMFALALTDTLGFLVMLMGQISGILNALGIILVVLWALFAAGAWIYWFVGGRTV